MSTKSFVQPFVVVVAMLLGMNACATDVDTYGSHQQAVEPPMMVTATAVSATRIDVAWDSVPGAFKYYVFQSASNGPFTYRTSVLEPSTSFAVQNLTPSTLYAFHIVSVHTDGSESVPSAAASATTLGATSGAPTNITATAVSSSQINVSWTSVPNAFKYYVRQSTAGGPFVHVRSVLEPTTSYQAMNLQPNTQYCYQLVSVFNGGSESGASTPVCATTTTGAPQDVTATAISDTRITVSWTAVANASKYYVYQSQAGGPSTYVGTAVAPATSRLIVNLMPSTTYCYQVRTVFVGGTESALSTPPRCATTFATGGGNFQGWYKLDERSGTTALDSSGFNRNGTISNAAYSLSDKPQIDDNRSALSFTSATSSLVTMPAAPGFNLTGSFTVAFWAKVPAGDAARFIGMRAPNCGALGWEIAQDATNGLHFAGENETLSFGSSLPANAWTHVAVTHAAGTMTLFLDGQQVAQGAYTSTNSVNGPMYLGHVAGCAGGAVLLDEVQIYSRALAPADVASLGTLPPAPTNLAVASKTSVSMTLAWDPVPGATSYILSKGTAAGNEQFYTHIPAGSSFEVDHLTPNTQYSFTVRAVVNGLFSDPSNSAVDTTNAGPAAPQNVTATVVAPDRISVTWDAVTGARKYYVFRSVNGGAFTYAGSVLAPDTTHLSVNLQPNTTYAFVVQAEDAGQITSPMSAPASATTPP